MQKFIEPYLVLDCIETLCSLQTTRFGNCNAIFFPRAARSKTAKMHGYLIMLNLRSGDAVLLPFLFGIRWLAYASFNLRGYQQWLNAPQNLFSRGHAGHFLGPSDFFGPRAKKFAFTRQKIRRAAPKVTARVPIFRSAGPKLNVV